MKLPRYPKYKDSGVKWLGDVPAHWEVVGLTKYLSSLVDYRGRTPTKTEDGVFLVTARNIRNGIIDYGASQEYIEPTEYEEVMRRGRPELGDVLFTTEAPLGQVAMIDRTDIALAQRIIKFRGDSTRLANHFLKYWIMGSACQFNLEQLATGSTALGIKGSKVGQVRLCLPPLDEQVSIVSFLDTQALKIDALVEEQRRLIDLLKEKRQAIISQAVTKGLDPDVPMRPSGISWIGDIPNNWVVIPIRFVAKLESGHTPSRSHPEYWEDCTIPWFTLADIWQIREGGRDFVTETAEMVSDIGLANSSARLLPKDTVMLSRTASVGFSAIMGCDMATSQDFANWVCGQRLQPEFLLLVFRAMSNEFNRLKFGSTHNTIYMPDIRSFRMALPPIEEQSHIVATTQSRLSEMDDMIAEGIHIVELLQERRSALISAAVTGQIDVCSYQPRETRAVCQ